MCGFRRELSNEYLLAKIGVDTAENEPLEVWGKCIQYDSFVSLVVLAERCDRGLQLGDVEGVGRAAEVDPVRGVRRAGLAGLPGGTAGPNQIEPSGISTPLQPLGGLVSSTDFLFVPSQEIPAWGGKHSMSNRKEGRK